MNIISDEELIKLQPDYVRHQEDIKRMATFEFLPWNNRPAIQELDNDIMKAIVRCRRNWAPAENMAYIDYVMTKHFDSHHKHHWNSRWLLSIVDTYAEDGKTPVERANALNITSIITHAKLLDSYLAMVNDPTFNREKFLANRGQQPLWDGFLTVQLAYDDVFINFGNRLKSSLEKTPNLYKLFMELFKRMQESDSAYTMTCLRHNGFLYGSWWDINKRRPQWLEENKEWIWT